MEESARQGVIDKIDRIRRNVELIAGDVGALRENITRNLELIVAEVSDLRDIRANMDTNLDRVSVALGNPHQDLGMLGGVILALGKAWYGDYSPGHLPQLLRGENRNENRPRRAHKLVIGSRRVLRKNRGT